jgi:misacylated tRNA(Ala) deacylase
VVDERRKAEKRVNEVETELAGWIAKGLVSEMSKDGHEDKRLRKKHLHRIDDASNPLGFLSIIAFSISDRMKTEAMDLPYLTVLSSSPSAQTPKSFTTVLVIGSDDKKVKEAGDGLKSKLNIKGGGKGPRWSGKFGGVWKDTKESAGVEGVLADIDN